MKYETLLEYEKFPLYHSVMIHNRSVGNRAIDLLNSEILKIPKEISDKAALNSRNPNTISFSRNINHPFYQMPGVMIFTFDKNKLRHNYKLTPHIGDWINVTRDNEHREGAPKLGPIYKYREAEERAVRSIPNFGKYLINIMLPREMYDNYYAMANPYQSPEISSRDLNHKRDTKYPWIKPLYDFSTKYKLPVIPKKNDANESVLEAMLEEDQVFSSWIDDLTYVPDQEAVLMTLLSGRNYMVYEMEEEMFDAWIDAPSQGVFWHEYIRDFHQVM